MSDEKIVKVYWNTPDDILAITHGGNVPMDMIPAGMESLAGTPIENQLVVMAKLRDETGKEIGIHTEIEIFPREGEPGASEGTFEVYLTVVLPGRGALVVYETKSYTNPEIMGPYNEMLEKGEWTGNVPVVQTAGPLPDRHGKVIAATGEFEGLVGRQQQIGIFTRMTPQFSNVNVCETFWLTKAE